MIVAEEIRNAVLRVAEERGTKPFRAADVARQISPAHWEDLLEQVKLVIDSLVKEGKVTARNAADKPQYFNAK